MVHLVQIGVLGWIGRFDSVDRRLHPRGSQVVCRTSRGLEVGAVIRALADNKSPQAGGERYDGQLLRRVTPEDRLILERQERFRDRAFSACSRLLQERGVNAVLVDVEHLFDGQGLYFYFLGDVPDEVSAMTEELAETWEARVQFRRFTERLTNGCGPDCGTGTGHCGTACGTGEGCSSCAVRQTATTGTRQAATSPAEGN